MVVVMGDGISARGGPIIFYFCEVDGCGFWVQILTT
eukprot:COSAG01_NODE_63_length_29632_cov_270.650662_26_plen_36_part_00